MLSHDVSVSESTRQLMAVLVPGVKDVGVYVGLPWWLRWHKGVAGIVLPHPIAPRRVVILLRERPLDTAIDVALLYHEYCHVWQALELRLRYPLWGGYAFIWHYLAEVLRCAYEYMLNRYSRGKWQEYCYYRHPMELEPHRRERVLYTLMLQYGTWPKVEVLNELKTASSGYSPRGLMVWLVVTGPFVVLTALLAPLVWGWCLRRG